MLRSVEFRGFSDDSTKFRVGRFVHKEKRLKNLYEIRDRYAKFYPKLAGEKNFFTLLNFFEMENRQLKSGDKDRINGIRKAYGKDFPDIPALYSKMNLFFQKLMIISF